MRVLCRAAFMITMFLPDLLMFGQATRDISVKDIIGMTRLADADYFAGRTSDGRVAQFAPDGQHFVIVLRRGDLKFNTNEYSVYLYTSKEIFRHGMKPRVLLAWRSTSNRPAIRSIRWLSDSHTLAFAGEHEHESSQVYTLNIITGTIIRRTHHDSGVDSFDISQDGRQVLFTAKALQSVGPTKQQKERGILIEDQPLADLLGGRFNYKPDEESLFRGGTEERGVPIPRSHQVNKNSQIFLSPNGQFAIVSAYFRTGRRDWAGYRSSLLQYWAKNSPSSGRATTVAQYFLVTLSSGSVHPLLDAPALWSSSIHWTPDSRSVFLKSFLPLGGQGGGERQQRGSSEMPAEISVPDSRLRRLSAEEWKESQVDEPRDRPSIRLVESINKPPTIQASIEATDQSVMLFNLNPQFSGLGMGHVEEIPITVHGIPIVFGLYLPPDFVKGQRYPLVVQTHGFDRNRFSMDGRNEWSSGFAARALVAKGILVAQMQDFHDPADHDRMLQDRSLGATALEAARNFSVECYEDAIRYLDDQGMIDPARVGISGFSRTVWFTSFALTHAPKLFRAAVLTDGMSGGYFEYIANQDSEFVEDNGGLAPFGERGLDRWLKESPGFNLDKVCTPTRLVSITDPILLSEWEWFVTERAQQKPAELVLIQNGTHMLEKPRDRYIAMQGMVDWFRFWLQDYVDPDPSKQLQYKRWQAFKEMKNWKPLAAACDDSLGNF
jgi:dipeptidyl aminopeptidase/acylaminoacyl peptidase